MRDVLNELPRDWPLPENERDAAFYRKIKPSKNSDCSIWTGPLSRDGYGIFYDDYRNHLAHRWAYERFRAPIPAGMELDHVCRRRRCVNPEHLEPVSHETNMFRMHQRRCQDRLWQLVELARAEGALRQSMLPERQQARRRPERLRSYRGSR